MYAYHHPTHIERDIYKAKQRTRQERDSELTECQLVVTEKCRKKGERTFISECEDKKKMEVPRTTLADVRLERTLVLFGVHDPRCIQCDGAFSMRDNRRRPAWRERRMKRCIFAAEVRHAPGDLA